VREAKKQRRAQLGDLPPQRLRALVRSVGIGDESRALALRR
jgi:hypothetical protein